MPMKKSGLFRNKNAKATPYKDKGMTEVGKEAKTQSYKEYVQKMFGGGMTEPSMKKNKMMGGGRTPFMQQPRKMPTQIGGGMMGPRGTAPQSLNTKRPIDPVLPRGKKGRGDI
jgi:hypothetical protein